MPNTPALIGAGVTGLYALPRVSEASALAQNASCTPSAQGLGERESQIDALTAIFGSGPAYVFYFIESQYQAATELVFTPKQALQLSIETVHGAARLAALSEEPASVLRQRAPSKGGTTEAALRTMA
jgi:pyrroline-5-carboxylate reductase